MLSYNDLLESIKKASVNAVASSKPCEICFGIVSKISPLEIKIDEKLILSEKQLIIGDNFSKRDIKITINGYTNDATIDNSLKTNEQIVLLRVQGGQKYLVVDRVVV